MEKKLISKIFIIFIIVTMMNMMIGCSKEKITEPVTENSTPNATQYSTDDNELNDVFSENTMSASVFNSNSYELNIGMSVLVTNINYSTEKFNFSYSWYDSDSLLQSRNCALNNDLTGCEVYDNSGDLIYGFLWEMGVDNITATINQVTAENTLSTTYFKNESRRIFTINGQNLDVAFANEEQAEYAGYLYENYTFEEISSFPQEDQELYEKITTVNSFIADNYLSNSIEEDINIIHNLLTNKDFLHDLTPPYVSMESIPGWWKKLCAIATLVALVSCWCFLIPICAVICVPAVGLEVTCAAVALLS